MPTRSRRENTFVQRFLSAYENFSWADATVEWLDEQFDGAVEVIATRKSDGKRLAIEHTIIEPFISEKEDFAFFRRAEFLKIEEDSSLPVPGRWISVFVPAGILRGRGKAERAAIVEGVHDWLKRNRVVLPSDFSQHSFPVVMSQARVLEVTIYVRVVPLSGLGKLHVRRQQTEVNLGSVIEKALKNKVPKLVRAEADKRILLLERQHMNLLPRTMLGEVERRRPSMPELMSVDEIWILETMDYERSGYLRFERFQGDSLIESLNFEGTEFLH